MLSSPGQYGKAGWNIIRYTKNWQVQFLVRAHTKVAGLIPDRDVWEVTDR